MMTPTSSHTRQRTFAEDHTERKRYTEARPVGALPTAQNAANPGHRPNEDAMARRLVGGSIGYIYPTIQYSRFAGGSAGWIESW